MILVRLILLIMDRKHWIIAVITVIVLIISYIKRILCRNVDNVACHQFSTKLLESVLHKIKLFNMSIFSVMSLSYRGLITYAAMESLSIVVIAPLFNHELIRKRA